MRFKTIPYLTRAELRALMDCTHRLPDGCLIFESSHAASPHLFTIRGERFCAARLVWAETYGFSQAALDQLETHEVAHIPECPHTGPAHYSNQPDKPLCIEPTHLILAQPHDVNRFIRERRSAYGGAK